MWHVRETVEGQAGLAGMRERKKPLERPRHKWEHIKMDLQVTGWGDVVWIDLP
jgi:hypothetical protein